MNTLLKKVLSPFLKSTPPSRPPVALPGSGIPLESIDPIYQTSRYGDAIEAYNRELGRRLNCAVGSSEEIADPKLLSRLLQVKPEEYSTELYILMAETMRQHNLQTFLNSPERVNEFLQALQENPYFLTVASGRRDLHLDTLLAICAKKNPTATCSYLDHEAARDYTAWKKGGLLYARDQYSLNQDIAQIVKNVLLKLAETKGLEKQITRFLKKHEATNSLLQQFPDYPTFTKSHYTEVLNSLKPRRSLFNTIFRRFPIKTFVGN